MKPKSNNSQPCPNNGQIGRGGNGTPKKANIVGKQHLFSKAGDKALHAVAKFVKAVGSLTQLVGNVLIADDWPGNKLRKQGNIGAERNDVSLHFGISTVHINGVAHGLEGIKGNADGQGQIQQRQLAVEDAIDGSDEEIRIFEKEQQSQIGQHRNHQSQF